MCHPCHQQAARDRSAALEPSGWQEGDDDAGAGQQIGPQATLQGHLQAGLRHRGWPRETGPGGPLHRRQGEGLKVSICGEHDSGPASIRVFHRTGLDDVSCSPFRVPIARLAAAQATLADE